MAKTPLLTAAQFRSIADHLPPNRRDRLVISALLFRFSSGRSLRETSEIFDVSRARLNEWQRALTDALPTIMRKLHLSPANPRMWRRGGQDWCKRSGGYDRVMDFRLQNFGRALK